MGFLEPNERHSGIYGQDQITPSGKAITVHSYEHARTALKVACELDVALTLLSAPGAAAYAGVGWFRALTEDAAAQFPDVQMTPILDCAAAAGDALAALREGLPVIRFNGGRKVNIKLLDIARQLGATVIARRPRALDLGTAEGEGVDLAAACRDWLKP